MKSSSAFSLVLASAAIGGAMATDTPTYYPTASSSWETETPTTDNGEETPAPVPTPATTVMATEAAVATDATTTTEATVAFADTIAATTTAVQTTTAAATEPPESREPLQISSVEAQDQEYFPEPYYESTASSLPSWFSPLVSVFASSAAGFLMMAW